MSSLKTITFSTVAGGTQTLRLQNYEKTTVIEHWGTPDRAVSGKLRQNVRGTRQRYRIEYEHCIEGTEYRSLFNNIISDLTGGEESIVLSEGSSLSDTRVVVPTEEFIERMEYSRTIISFMPMMEFEDKALDNAAGGWVEADWVESDWVEVG